jgi:hypothetical protein
LPSVSRPLDPSSSTRSCLVDACPADALLRRTHRGHVPLEVAILRGAPDGVLRLLVDRCPGALLERNSTSWGELLLHGALREGAP